MGRSRSGQVMGCSRYSLINGSRERGKFEEWRLSYLWVRKVDRVMGVFVLMGEEKLVKFIKRDFSYLWVTKCE